MPEIPNFLKIDKNFILASKSPRRRNLLKLLGFNFEVLPASIDEEAFDTDSPEELVRQLAEEKALTVAKSVKDNSYILGSDTTVFLGGEILNKPSDEIQAAEMLSKLSNNTHVVYSGIAIVETPQMRISSAVEKTEVSFRLLDNEEIQAYISTGSPFDKAGGYGIQDDFGAVFVRKINGCYYNVVGLPLQLLYKTLRNFISEK